MGQWIISPSKFHQIGVLLQIYFYLERNFGYTLFQDIYKRISFSSRWTNHACLWSEANYRIWQPICNQDYFWQSMKLWSPALSIFQDRFSLGEAAGQEVLRDYQLVKRSVKHISSELLFDSRWFFNCSSGIISNLIFSCCLIMYITIK